MASTENTAKQLDALIARTREQHEEMTPDKDLWRGIETSITRAQLKKNSARKGWWAGLTTIAACALVAVGITLSWSPAGNHAMPALNGLDLVALLTQQHESQRQVLLTNFSSAGYEQSLSDLEVELQQLRDAAVLVTEQLRAEPDNTDLWRFLQWLH